MAHNFHLCSKCGRKSTCGWKPGQSDTHRCKYPDCQNKRGPWNKGTFTDEEYVAYRTALRGYAVSQAAGVGRARNEAEVQQAAVSRLEEECGKGHVYEKVRLDSGPGKNREIDIVAVQLDGTLIVCECEDSILLGASKGLGQLLMYRAFIEVRNEALFDPLIRRGDNRLGRGIANIRYRLILPLTKRTDVSESTLRSVVSYVPASARAMTELRYV